MFHHYKGKQWETFKADLEESCCVCISIEGNKIKLIGDKELLNHTIGDVQQFIEKECNIEKSISLCEAQWRLLTTYMLTKWNKIEQKVKRSKQSLNFVFPIEGCEKFFLLFLKEKSQSVADVSLNKLKI